MTPQLQAAVAAGCGRRREVPGEDDGHPHPNVVGRAADHHNEEQLAAPTRATRDRESRNRDL
jgi:hypothetical protein